MCDAMLADIFDAKMRLDAGTVDAVFSVAAVTSRGIVAVKNDDAVVVVAAAAAAAAQCVRCSCCCCCP